MPDTLATVIYTAHTHTHTSGGRDGRGQTTYVFLGNTADGGFVLAAQLTAHLPGLEAEDKAKLVDEAHQICPYSKASRGNIEVGFVIP
ncbi:MAG: hypothetical protein CTR55_06750 [Pseudomonas sp.]|uniref:hypothetical protein n=1 Tax=Pseudomonas sp. TaxID=306 RepID=UPI000CC2CDCF|nr:hypothetical protein [Pseudomonas sp.]PJI49065.1 MAG: hypothetical protein CTR55_06750 [Pseudomonas sp.]